MSEVSVLSNQYKAVVDTNDRVNNSIIALKKRSISTSSLKENFKNIKLSEEELVFAKEYLLHFLEYLQNLKTQNITDSEYLPKTIVKDFQNKIVNTIPFFESEIKQIIEAITVDQSLDKNQFNLLDKMASTLDNERTVLFRKLRTARG
jgi:hypothetical protein